MEEVIYFDVVFFDIVCTFECELLVNNLELELEFDNYLAMSGKYYGPYQVTPSVEPQTIPTRSRVMVDDLQVTEIPFFEVSNTAGTTVIIGG